MEAAQALGVSPGLLLTSSVVGRQQGSHPSKAQFPCLWNGDNSLFLARWSWDREIRCVQRLVPGGMWEMSAMILIVFIFYRKSLSSRGEGAWEESGLRANPIHVDDNFLGAFFLFLCPSHIPGFPRIKLMFQTHSYQILSFVFSTFHPFKWKKSEELGRPASHRPALFGSQTLPLFPLPCSTPLLWPSQSPRVANKMNQETDQQMHHLDTLVSEDVDLNTPLTETSSWWCPVLLVT